MKKGLLGIIGGLALSGCVGLETRPNKTSDEVYTHLQKKNTIFMITPKEGKNEMLTADLTATHIKLRRAPDTKNPRKDNTIIEDSLTGTLGEFDETDTAYIRGRGYRFYELSEDDKARNHARLKLMYIELSEYLRKNKL